jgi:hypothetical protein
VTDRNSQDASVQGKFVDFAGERYYAIQNVDRMAPFFISVISNADHWLFVSSTGGLTAGRVSPDTALFPYVTVDKVHDSALHTGCKTLLRVGSDGEPQHWEPMNPEHDWRYAVSRNLYKNTLGNKLCFEEINHDLQLGFRYTWVMSAQYGLVRQCELQNLGDQPLSVDVLDGFQNILPAGTPRVAQTNSSNLVDAYKWTELDAATGLAFFTLFSGITDRAEPCESLRANTVFCLGLPSPVILISSEQVAGFRENRPLQTETHKRGVRGAYLVNSQLELVPGASQRWQFVVNTEQNQAKAASLRKRLAAPDAVAEEIEDSVSAGSDELARILASADGFQATAEEEVSVHHYANVLFNVLRGGIFDDQYNVLSWDFACTVEQFNDAVYQRNRELLLGLPERVRFPDLLERIRQNGDPQLERLCSEYLPIRFGRRHGDPSRPWNQFAIRLQDEDGNKLLSYEGNWRDIFQNWEALTFSYPEFVENVIAKFVNASTVDGYNPYRITKEGIDWEVEEPDDPWSYIGYWGDHQIIYLQKLLELSSQFHPDRLSELLHRPIFCYANVPYRIKPFDALVENPKDTVEFDEALATRIEDRVANTGADGKLVLDADGTVYQVTLIEKLLVPLLCKLGNLVIDGGIWMNTQRPEWNDANNALVGQGLSMVTLYYMRRYMTFLSQVLASESGDVELSTEVAQWLEETAAALGEARASLGDGPVDAAERFALLHKLGDAACRYRGRVYRQGTFSGKSAVPVGRLTGLLDDALAAIDHSIRCNKRDDGLYHAYNLLHFHDGTLTVDHLYSMLEGQVAALSAGAIAPGEAVQVVEALFASDVYREDQLSFLLYPDRELPSFLEKNRIPPGDIEAIPLLAQMVEGGDERLVMQDVDGRYRFNARFTSVGELDAALDALAVEFGDDLEAARKPLRSLYERVFNHKAFTGRSGGMFGFEGLGSIYWHMVSKLLLAVQENFFSALESGGDPAVIARLGQLYYRVREGIGFNKTPAEYGAFPTDPYSHTPKHAGAQQPGMTGQVKEEVLSRFGELGIRVQGGGVTIRPDLLREQEFVPAARRFRYLDVDSHWQALTVPAGALAFSWCQVPVVYSLSDAPDSQLTITWNDGRQQTIADLAMPPELACEIFARTGRIRRIDATFAAGLLFA